MCMVYRHLKIYIYLNWQWYGWAYNIREPVQIVKTVPPSDFHPAIKYIFNIIWVYYNL